MKNFYLSRRIMLSMAAGFLMVTGTYNAVVINSESRLTGADVRFIKRLDEVYGVVKSNRVVAASIGWQKLSSKKVARKERRKQRKLERIARQEARREEPSTSSANTEIAQAAVQEELNLNLTEVINPKKWQQGLSNTQFTGSLVTNNGVIEDLNVALPNGEGLAVSFSEMTGNVFEYDLDGAIYSGMMYQVDQNSYMVTLTNGPLEGTRMRFTAEPTFEQQMAAEQLQYEQSLQVADNYGNNADTYAQEQIQQAVHVQQATPENYPQYQHVQEQYAQQGMDPYGAQDVLAQEQGNFEQNGEQNINQNFDQQAL